MLDLDKVLRVIGKEENSNECTIQEDLDNERFVLRLSKRLTYLLLRRKGKAIGKSNSFANKSLRYYSEIEIPNWWTAKLIQDGGVGEIKFSQRKLNFLSYIDISHVFLDNFSLTKTKKFKIKKTYTDGQLIDSKTGKIIKYTVTIYTEEIIDFTEHR